MKALVVGANGFIGKHVAEQLDSHCKVVRVARTQTDGCIKMDATNYANVLSVLKEAKPGYVVNCAGIVENSEAAAINVLITQNLLKAIVELKLDVKRVVFTGSAAEYGVVESLPVHEDSPIKPTSLYGNFKAEEVQKGLAFAEQHKLDVIVVRIFNPIGPGMADRFLIPVLIRQINEIMAGKRSYLEVSRIDSLRDYLDVRDVAKAIVELLFCNALNYRIYNVGSGVKTSTQQLINLIVHASGLKKNMVHETTENPEPMIASQADISRITQDTDWQPIIRVDTTIKDIMEL